MIDVSADADALFWLGRADIRFDSHRVAVPDAAFDLDLLDPDERTFWAADPEIPAAFLTNHEDLFEDDDAVLLAGSGDVDGERVAAVPAMLFESMEESSDAETVPVFGPGTTVHFLTNPDLLHAEVCLAAPARAARELFEARVGTVT